MAEYLHHRSYKVNANQATVAVVKNLVDDKKNRSV